MHPAGRVWQVGFLRIGFYWLQPKYLRLNHTPKNGSKVKKPINQPCSFPKSTCISSTINAVILP
jgi:hypothetical protein